MSFSPKDPRTIIIPAVWGIVLAITAAAIPLGAVTANRDIVVLPILAILGATVTSAIVWLKPTRRLETSEDAERKIAELSLRVAQLEIESNDRELSRNIREIETP